MSAHWLVRAAVKARIAEILQNSSQVPVFRAFPPQQPDECIWLSNTQGGFEYNVMGTNLPRDDKFTVTVMVMAYKPGQDPADAEGRAEEIASTVVIALANDLRLDDEAGDEFSILDALIGGVDGPDAMPGPNGEGWDAFVRIQIDVHLRITREQ